MVEPLSYMSFQPVLHNLYYTAHIKDSLLLMGNEYTSIPCTGGSGFPLLIYMVLNHMSHGYITVNKMGLEFSFFLYCTALCRTVPYHIFFIYKLGVHISKIHKCTPFYYMHLICHIISTQDTRVIQTRYCHNVANGHPYVFYASVRLCTCGVQNYTTCPSHGQVLRASHNQNRLFVSGICQASPERVAVLLQAVQEG